MDNKELTSKVELRSITIQLEEKESYKLGLLAEENGMTKETFVTQLVASIVEELKPELSPEEQARRKSFMTARRQAKRYIKEFVDEQDIQELSTWLNDRKS